MNAAELKDNSREELNQKLEDLRQEFFNLKFQHATGQLDNPMRLGATKKNIARVMTELRQRELAEA